jgi:hypothetical protein
VFRKTVRNDRIGKFSFSFFLQLDAMGSQYHCGDQVLTKFYNPENYRNQNGETKLHHKKKKNVLDVIIE